MATNTTILLPPPSRREFDAASPLRRNALYLQGVHDLNADAIASLLGQDVASTTLEWLDDSSLVVAFVTDSDVVSALNMASASGFDERGLLAGEWMVSKPVPNCRSVNKSTAARGIKQRRRLAKEGPLSTVYMRIATGGDVKDPLHDGRTDSLHQFRVREMQRVDGTLNEAENEIRVTGGDILGASRNPNLLSSLQQMKIDKPPPVVSSCSSQSGNTDLSLALADFGDASIPLSDAFDRFDRASGIVPLITTTPTVYVGKGSKGSKGGGKGKGSKGGKKRKISTDEEQHGKGRNAQQHEQRLPAPVHAFALSNSIKQTCVSLKKSFKSITFGINKKRNSTPSTPSTIASTTSTEDPWASYLEANGFSSMDDSMASHPVLCHAFYQEEVCTLCDVSECSLHLIKRERPLRIVVIVPHYTGKGSLDDASLPITSPNAKLVRVKLAKVQKELGLPLFVVPPFGHAGLRGGKDVDAPCLAGELFEFRYYVHGDLLNNNGELLNNSSTTDMDCDGPMFPGVVSTSSSLPSKIAFDMGAFALEFETGSLTRLLDELKSWRLLGVGCE